MSSPEDLRPLRPEASLRDRLAAVADDALASEPVAATEPAKEPRAAAAGPAPRPATSSRGGSRARHATRARRTGWALAFFPIFAIYVIVDALHDLRDRLARERSIDLERRPPFARPASMPTGSDRSVQDIAAAIESFPFNPARVSSQATFFRDNGPDALSALLSANPNTSNFPHTYPAHFQHRLFAGHDGVQLSGMQAMHDHAGPALIICHGLLMTKNFDVIIQLAKRAFEEWGFHVVTFDLRGWGQSMWTTDAPASAGYYEGRDIVEVARMLHRNPLVTSVGGVGYSLGGASMFSAAAVSSASEDRPIDGGVIGVSAPVDIADALEHISTKPGWRDPYFGLWHVFRAAIKSNVRRRGLRRDLRTWHDLVAEMSAPYYGVTMEEFCHRASVMHFADQIDSPVLDLHAADDFLVPVTHAYRLRDAAADNPNVHVLVRDAGSHCAFAAADSAWFHSVVRRWAEYWATPGELRIEVEDPAEDAEAVS